MGGLFKPQTTEITSPATQQLQPGSLNLIQKTFQDPQAIANQFSLQSPLGQQSAETFSQLIGQDPAQTQMLNALRQQHGMNTQLGVESIQQGGGRFATAQGQQIGQFNRQASTDFNALIAQVMQQQQQQQLQNLMAAGQFAQGQQQLGQQSIMPMLNMGLQAGLAPPTVISQPSAFGQVAGLAGGIGSLALGGGMLGGGGGATAPVMSGGGGGMPRMPWRP